MLRVVKNLVFRVPSHISPSPFLRRALLMGERCLVFLGINHQLCFIYLLTTLNLSPFKLKLLLFDSVISLIFSRFTLHFTLFNLKFLLLHLHQRVLRLLLCFLLLCFCAVFLQELSCRLCRKL